MKRKIIKNVGVLFGIVVLVLSFFLAYGNKISSGENLIFPYMLPFYMMIMVLSIFSFYWSLRENNAMNFINIVIVLVTLFFNFVFILVEALNAASIFSLAILSYILLAIAVISMLVCLIYAIVLDFKKPKNN